VLVLGSTATAYYTGSAWAFLSAVSSVGLSAPTGFTVTGSPVTTNGTIALAFAAGYSLPTTAKQTQWDAAVNGGVLSLPASAASLINNGVYRVRNSGRSLTLSTAADGFTFTSIPDDNKYTWTATASGTAFRDKLSDEITSPATIEGSAVFTYDATANQWLILQ
jgi:frataxin-like iron-binding protein CyaY